MRIFKWYKAKLLDIFLEQKQGETKNLNELP